MYAKEESKKLLIVENKGESGKRAIFVLYARQLEQ